LVSEPKKYGSDRCITIVGQSGSGKTHILSALLHSASACDQLIYHEPSLLNPRFQPLPTQSIDDEINLGRLQTQFESILAGHEDLVAGTDNVCRYPAMLRYDQPVEPSVATNGKKGWGLFGRQPEKVDQKTEQVYREFQIVDGRGGDLAQGFAKSEADRVRSVEDSNNLLLEYRDGMAASVGIIICLPTSSAEFDPGIMRRFQNEIQRAIADKADDPSLPPLERVSLCFTKYEAHFVDYGPDAFDAANDPDVFIEMMREQPAMKLFRESLAHEPFDFRIFPVSTYGFVSGSGGANFYNYEHMPGLMSRVIPEEDFSNPELPKYRDHFPVALNAGQAEQLWHPFNIAPPFVYALTGEEYGPLCLRPEEFV